MSQHVSSAAQQITAGATIGGGGLSFLTTHSSEITVLAVVVTAVASIAFGIWNARIQTKRNEINKRNIIEDILSTLSCDMSVEEMEKIRKSLRK